MANGRRFKYGHILWLDEIKFNPRVPQMICDPENQFEADQHLFITPHQKVFDEIKQYTENAVLAEVSAPTSPDVINRYAENCDWVIVHAMPQPHHALRIKKKYWKKIIWRTWGHDVGYAYPKGQLLKNAVRRIFDFFWRQQVRQFRAVGVSYVVDKIALTKKFGPLEFYRMPYALRNNQVHLKEALETMSKEGDTINILVGHSGRRHDNHIEILKRLECFRNEDIRLWLVLSYGDPAHIAKVKEFVHTHWADKATIITEMMSHGDYFKFLSKMDIAILDSLCSNALGNISPLLYFKKKIFLNRNGVIREAFDMEKIPYGCTDEIATMTFESLVQPVVYSGSERSLIARSYEENIAVWKELLNNL